MSDWESRFQSSLSTEQEKNIVDQLNAGLENLKRQKEEREAAAKASEINDEGDGLDSSNEGDTGENRGRREGFERNLQEEIERQWQDEFEGVEKEKGEHTTAEFENLLKIGIADSTFEVSEGNMVSMRTLTQDEELEAVRRSSFYPNNMQSRVFILYSLSQSLQALNGRAWFRRKPLSRDDDVLEEKFKKVCSLRSPVVERLIGEYNKLTAETLEKARYAKKG